MKKQMLIYGAIICFALFIMYGCTKKESSTEQLIIEPVPTNYSNINLQAQSIATIQKVIAGRWQHVMDATFGWSGWVMIYPTNRYVSFLPNDSVKIEYNNAVSLYEKANYVWGRSSHTTDSVYTFTVPGKISWVMNSIFNDTLKIDAWPDLIYLVRKS